MVDLVTENSGLGQEFFKCEKWCQPHRTGLFSQIIVTRPDQCPEAGGTEIFVRLPVGSRLTPFRDLGSLGGGGGGGGGAGP